MKNSWEDPAIHCSKCPGHWSSELGIRRHLESWKFPEVFRKHMTCNRTCHKCWGIGMLIAIPWSLTCTHRVYITFSHRAQRQTHCLNLTPGKQGGQGFPALLGPESLCKSMIRIRPKVQLTPYLVCRSGQQQMFKEDLRPAKSHNYVASEQLPSLQSSACTTTTADHILELFNVHFYSPLPHASY